MQILPRRLRTPSAFLEPPPPPQDAARQTVRRLRLEVEGRGWAIRAPRGSTRTVLDIALEDSQARDAARDPLVTLLTQLRTAIFGYVYRLRADGLRPEQMLVQVKAFVRDAIDGCGWTDPEATRALTAEVVRWSIEAYYER